MEPRRDRSLHEADPSRRPHVAIVVDPTAGPNEFGRRYKAASRLVSAMPELTSLESLEEAPHAEVFEERTPRTVRLRLDADEHVPKHRHPESNVVLHVLSGAVELTLGDDVYDLESGDVIRFDGDQDVSPHAVEDSTALVVFAPKTDS